MEMLFKKHKGFTVLEIGIASAVINFNNGMVWMLRVSVKLGVISGSNSIDYCSKADRYIWI